jgi:hypothetical protein
MPQLPWTFIILLIGLWLKCEGSTLILPSCFTTFQNTWNWQKLPWFKWWLQWRTNEYLVTWISSSLESIINWLNIWLCVFTCLGNFFDNTKFPYNEVVRTWYLEKCWYALNVWKFFNCNSLIIQHKTSCFIFGCSFGNMYTSNCNHYFYFVHLTFF